MNQLPNIKVQIDSSILATRIIQNLLISKVLINVEESVYHMNIPVTNDYDHNDITTILCNATIYQTHKNNEINDMNLQLIANPFFLSNIIQRGRITLGNGIDSLGIHYYRFSSNREINIDNDIIEFTNAIRNYYTDVYSNIVPVLK